MSENYLNTLLELMKKKKAWVILAIFVIVYVCWAYKHSAKPKMRSAREKSRAAESETPKLFKDSDFIPKESRRSAEPMNGAGRRGAEARDAKRNFATEIAVFLYQREKEKEAGASLEAAAKPKSFALPAGTKIPALVRDTIFSFNVGAPVTAEVTKDFTSGGEAKIAKGSKFLGEAGILKSLNRINVRFDLLILPDGSEHRVRALALSEDGSAGIKGRVSKQRDLRVLKALGETALAGVSLFAGGISRDPYSFEDNLRMNLTQNLTSEARQDLRGVKIDTSITVDGFTPIQVILLDGI